MSDARFFGLLIAILGSLGRLLQAGRDRDTVADLIAEVRRRRGA